MILFLAFTSFSKCKQIHRSGIIWDHLTNAKGYLGSRQTSMTEFSYDNS